MSPLGPRTKRLLRDLESGGIDYLLVTELSNVRYLTGFSGSNGLALVGPDLRLFVTDFRYVEQAAVEVDPEFERGQASGELVRAISGPLDGPGPLRLGFDDAHVSVRTHAKLRELLPGPIELVAGAGLVEARRRVKEPAEVERIAAAAGLAGEALEEVLARGVMGRTERELGLALEVAMRTCGATAPSFPPIIAAGSHGALPHAEPRDVTVQAGDLLVVDWGAVLDGYCSDCTRTFAVGPPAGQAEEVYELVLAANGAGLAAVRAGAGGREVDQAARRVITDAGYGEQFGHGLGHGVGLETHEGPGLSPRSDDVLEAGNVVTVEPGIYLPGQFGVRIEDLVVVGADGCEVLTGLGKDLRVVG
ncbi:MAG TPA: Xaa-Pro peptidase family protein [Solirubrobacteraceae bacterium]|nr:Xaa-Pro peptidase family protein [Solirubrobacteraceae bacterium]